MVKQSGAKRNIEKRISEIDFFLSFYIYTFFILLYYELLQNALNMIVCFYVKLTTMYHNCLFTRGN